MLFIVLWEELEVGSGKLPSIAGFTIERAVHFPLPTPHLPFQSTRLLKSYDLSKRSGRFI